MGHLKQKFCKALGYSLKIYELKLLDMVCVTNFLEITTKIKGGLTDSKSIYLFLYFTQFVNVIQVHIEIQQK